MGEVSTQTIPHCEYCNTPLVPPIYPDQRFCRGSETNCRKLKYQQRKRQRDKIDKTARQTIMQTGDTHLQQQQEMVPIILEPPERQLIGVMGNRPHREKRGVAVLRAAF